MPKVKVNGIILNYQIAGEGTPVVLISGLGYPMWQWHKMVPLLADECLVIALDNRGVGESEKPEGPYSAQLLAADVVGLLEVLGIDKAVIAGHSMGGFIAQAIALDYPERVDKLILCSTNFGGPNHVPVTAEAWAVLSDTASDPITRFKNGLRVSTAPGWAESNPEMVQEWVDWRVANPIDIQGYQSQLAIGLGLVSGEACFEGRLAEVAAPTLILFGADDKVVPPANADLLQSKIPDSVSVILPDAGHFFPIEVPEIASKHILDFVR
ncbi:MAG: alpha/beta fold hydrolase [Anaerolineales bacterium]|nr:alpha/beta fold hydrolase [Anaerolineales bacterium]